MIFEIRRGVRTLDPSEMAAEEFAAGFAVHVLTGDDEYLVDDERVTAEEFRRTIEAQLRHTRELL